MKSIKYMIIILIILNIASCSSNKVNSIESVEINRVSFDITTVASIKCDEFKQIFKNELEVITIYNKDDIKKFSTLLRNLHPVAAESPDTRAMVLIHTEAGAVDALCVSYTGIALNGVSMKPEKEMIDFIKNIKPLPKI